ncbi:MAG: ribonuclease H-like domain-containing protein [bacterium]
MNLIFDIETVGDEFETLSESQQEYLLRYVEKEKDEELKEEKKDEAVRFLSLYPFTAKVVAIGMLNAETEKTLVLYEDKKEDEWVVEEKKTKYRSYSEEKILKTFWEYAKKAERVVTFNGRNFDIPFLMMRSAMLKIKPSKNFMGYRYDITKHVDLLEQLTFFGATKKFNLDFYCRSFGIESPKSHGVSGMEVKELYKAGKIKDIAIYCGDDVRATFELFKIWNEYLNL